MIDSNDANTLQLPLGASAEFLATQSGVANTPTAPSKTDSYDKLQEKQRAKEADEEEQAWIAQAVAKDQNTKKLTEAEYYEKLSIMHDAGASEPADFKPTKENALGMPLQDFLDKYGYGNDTLALHALWQEANNSTETTPFLESLKAKAKAKAKAPKGNGEDKAPLTYPLEGLIPPIELKRNQALPKTRPPIQPLVTLQDKLRFDYYLEETLFKPNNPKFSAHQARIEFINLLIKVKGLPIYQRIIDHQRVLLHPDIIAEEIKYRTAKIPAGNLTLVEVTKGWLVTKLDAVQPTYTVERKGGATVRTDFPERWIPIYFDNPEAWTVPTIHRIMTAPYITEAGNILYQNGYNPETGYYLHYSGEPIRVPEEPTEEEIKASLARLKGLLTYYPFTKDDGASLSVVLSLLISLSSPHFMKTIFYDFFRNFSA